MPGRLPNTLLAGLCALVLAGCGSGDGGTIPPGEADTLIRLTDAVASDVANGDCEGAQAGANELAKRVQALPAEVDDDVQKALEDAAANLVQQTQDADQCQGTTGATGDGGAEPTISATTTEPTTTEPTTETTTTDESDETTTTTTTTTPDENQGGGQGGGPPEQAPPEQAPPEQAPPEQAPPEQAPPEGGDTATGSFDDSGGVGPEERTTP